MDDSVLCKTVHNDNYPFDSSFGCFHEQAGGASGSLSRFLLTLGRVTSS